jgi:hypothetical protein
MAAVQLMTGLLALALGVALIALRERMGGQARAAGHGVTPLAYYAVGAVLVVFGCVAIVGAVG